MRCGGGGAGDVRGLFGMASIWPGRYPGADVIVAVWSSAQCVEMMGSAIDYLLLIQAKVPVGIGIEWSD